MPDEHWGKKKIIMRNDGERAIKAFRKRIQEQRIEETILEESPKGDSASNGLAEEAVKSLEGMVRTWMDVKECKYKVKLSSSHVLMPWIVESAGEVIKRCKVGNDGRTAYQRFKGKSLSSKVVPFGERVLFIPSKAKANKKNTLESRWQYGIWAGRH